MSTLEIILSLSTVIAITGMLYYRIRANFEHQKTFDLQNQLNQTLALKIKFESELNILKTQNKQNQHYLEIKFKNLANEILKSNQDELLETNNKSLKQILEPVKNQLNEFKSKVEQAEQTDIRNTATLKQEFEHLRQANKRITEEAQQLTNALQGEKQKQGIWGEIILERVLEASGLEKGREFELQINLKNKEDKQYRPDAIVYLPNNRQIIIDSKTSINAYKGIVNTQNEMEKQNYSRQLTTDIEAHINNLSTKKYESLENINSLDFVLMFIPIEGALLEALKIKPTIYENAYKQNIVLVSPSTLLLALRTIAVTWRQEHQIRNVKKINEQAIKLYEKFVGFTEDMDKVGRAIKTARDSYNNAYGKLQNGRGNLVSQTEKLRKIAKITPNKQLSEKYQVLEYDTGEVE